MPCVFMLCVMWHSGRGIGGLTSEHAHCDAGSMALLDGGGHLGPQGVHDAHQSNEGQVLLHTVLSVLLTTPLLPFSVGLEWHEDVAVGYGQHPAA